MAVPKSFPTTFPPQFGKRLALMVIPKFEKKTDDDNPFSN